MVEPFVLLGISTFPGSKMWTLKAFQTAAKEIKNLCLVNSVFLVSQEEASSDQGCGIITEHVITSSKLK